ncbi:MAG: trigger factor [Myxococcota bacterium]|nr:trigger factor [Myxococcota bacterium]
MTSFESSDGQIQVEATEETPILRVLSVTVDASRVDKAFDRTYRNLQKEVRVKGFRPGKAPRSVLERMYGASVPDDIQRLLVAESLGDAIELASIVPVSEPQIDAERPAPSAAFCYEARVELKPEIELPDTQGLPAQRPSGEVAEDEVLTQLESLRERSAPLIEEAEGTAAEEGHTLTMDFVGSVDGEAFEGGSAKGHELELGSGRLVPGFEEQLAGVVAGDDRQLEIDFPDDYGNADLAGKHAVFDVHVEAVKKRQLPELDDEFAKDLGDEFETLEELRDRIRSDLQSQRDQVAQQMLRRTVMDSLIERTDFEVPPGVVERQLQHQIESFRQEYGNQLPAEVLQSQLDRIAEEGREAAERRVREAFLLEAVAKAESIEATDEDIDQRIGEMAEARGMPPEQLRKIAHDQGWYEAMRSEFVDQKALDLLIERAEVEEVETDEP